MLNITKHAEDTKLEIILEGRLDSSTSSKLETEVRNSLAGVEKLVFEMEKLEYISSAGLRVLLAAQKTMNKQGSMVIRNSSNDVMDVFKLTGFADILTLE